MAETMVMDCTAIGRVAKDGTNRSIRVEPEYRSGLKGLEEFGHAMIIWWADRYADRRSELDMELELPYAPGRRSGLFATRSPMRPNPLGVNIARILSVNLPEGILELDEIDAFDGTLILDIKPYYGCIDRVQDYRQPDWVPADWGEWYVPLPEMNYG